MLSKDHNRTFIDSNLSLLGQPNPISPSTPFPHQDAIGSYHQQSPHHQQQHPSTPDAASAAPPSAPQPPAPLLDEYEEGKLQLATIPRLQLKSILHDKLRQEGVALASPSFASSCDVDSALQRLACRYAAQLKTHFGDVYSLLVEFRSDARRSASAGPGAVGSSPPRLHNAAAYSSGATALSSSAIDAARAIAAGVGRDDALSPSERSPIYGEAFSGPTLHHRTGAADSRRLAPPLPPSNHINAIMEKSPTTLLYGHGGVGSGMFSTSAAAGVRSGVISGSRKVSIEDHILQSPETEKRTGWDRLCRKLGLKKPGIAAAPSRSSRQHHPKSLCAAADLLASEMTMSDEDRVNLMLMVKDGLISPDEAVERVRMFEAARKYVETLKAASNASSTPTEKETFYVSPMQTNSSSSSSSAAVSGAAKQKTVSPSNSTQGLQGSRAQSSSPSSTGCGHPSTLQPPLPPANLAALPQLFPPNAAANGCVVNHPHLHRNGSVASFLTNGVGGSTLSTLALRQPTLQRPSPMSNASALSSSSTSSSSSSGAKKISYPSYLTPSIGVETQTSSLLSQSSCHSESIKSPTSPSEFRPTKYFMGVATSMGVAAAANEPTVNGIGMDSDIPYAQPHDTVGRHPQRDGSSGAFPASFKTQTGVSRGFRNPSPPLLDSRRNQHLVDENPRVFYGHQRLSDGHRFNTVTKCRDYGAATNAQDADPIRHTPGVIASHRYSASAASMALSSVGIRKNAKTLTAHRDASYGANQDRFWPRGAASSGRRSLKRSQSGESPTSSEDDDGGGGGGDHERRFRDFNLTDDSTSPLSGRRFVGVGRNIPRSNSAADSSQETASNASSEPEIDESRFIRPVGHATHLIATTSTSVGTSSTNFDAGSSSSLSGFDLYSSSFRDKLKDIGDELKWRMDSIGVPVVHEPDFAFDGAALGDPGDAYDGETPSDASPRGVPYSGSSSNCSLCSCETTSTNRGGVGVDDAGDVGSGNYGQFLGKARVHTSVIPSKYDRDALTLTEGDEIHIISMPASGVWTGLLHNRVGTFKAEFVDLASEVARRKPSNSDSRNFCPRHDVGPESWTPTAPQRTATPTAVTPSSPAPAVVASTAAPPPEPPPPPAPRRSRPQDVEDLLTRIEMTRYLGVFHDHGFASIDSFRTLEEADLDSMGVRTPDHRAKLLTAVEILNDFEAPLDSPEIAEKRDRRRRQRAAQEAATLTKESSPKRAVDLPVASTSPKRTSAEKTPILGRKTIVGGLNSLFLNNSPLHRSNSPTPMQQQHAGAIMQQQQQQHSNSTQQHPPESPRDSGCFASNENLRETLDSPLPQQQQLKFAASLAGDISANDSGYLSSTKASRNSFMTTRSIFGANGDAPVIRRSLFSSALAPEDQPTATRGMTASGMAPITSSIAGNGAEGAPPVGGMPGDPGAPVALTTNQSCTTCNVN